MKTMKMNFRQQFVRKIISKAEYHNFRIVRIIDSLIPKNNKLFLLGAFQGAFLWDNTYYFYRYLTKNKPEITLMMLVMDPAERKKLRTRFSNISIYDPYSLKGLYYAFKAKVIILVANLSSEIPTSFLFSNEKIIVNFSHGIPLKGICLTDTEWDEGQRNYYIDREAQRYDIYAACSKMEKLVNAASFGVPFSKIPITGSPKIDYLYHYLRGGLSKKSILDYFPNMSFTPKTIILYAPTKRETGAPSLLPFEDRDLVSLDNLLQRQKVLLLLRGHWSNIVNERYGVIDFAEFDGFKAISTLNVDRVENINDVLCDVDILITDYSSIYWDFLLLDRPIIFIPYDIGEYEKKPGLQFDYNLITAGPKVSSQQEFIHHIEQYRQDPTIDSEKRQFIRDLMHTHFDGKACERIYEEIQKLKQLKQY